MERIGFKKTYILFSVLSVVTLVLYFAYNTFCGYCKGHAPSVIQLPHTPDGAEVLLLDTNQLGPESDSTDQSDGEELEQEIVSQEINLDLESHSK